MNISSTPEASLPQPSDKSEETTWTLPGDRTMAGLQDGDANWMAVSQYPENFNNTL